ncbi:MAG: class I SAM-dependent methyltransferase [Acidobacteria bacterium]|nr:MAG: class I SAM-dependent methyltransferase [Acidobacteriota bacterium]
MPGLSAENRGCSQLHIFCTPVVPRTHRLSFAPMPRGLGDWPINCGALVGSKAPIDPMADLASSRRFWEEKAKENPLWYVSSYGSFAHRDEAQFWDSGDRIWREIKRAVGYQPTATDTVVELGCGVGRLTRAIATEVTVCHAFDISETMLARAREGIGHGVEFHLAEGASLRPMGDGVADLVLAYCVLQHLPSETVLAANLSEMVRVVKPGGLIVFTTAPRGWRSRLLPLSRFKSVLMAAFRRTGPKGTYKKEWVGIRPSRARVERLCPVPLEFRALPGERWLYWSRKPVAIERSGETG